MQEQLTILLSILDNYTEDKRDVLISLLRTKSISDILSLPDLPHLIQMIINQNDITQRQLDLISNHVKQLLIKHNSAFRLEELMNKSFTTIEAYRIETTEKDNTERIIPVEFQRKHIESQISRGRDFKNIKIEFVDEKFRISGLGDYRYIDSNTINAIANTALIYAMESDFTLNNNVLHVPANTVYLNIIKALKVYDSKIEQTIDGRRYLLEQTLNRLKNDIDQDFNVDFYIQNPNGQGSLPFPREAPTELVNFFSNTNRFNRTSSRINYILKSLLDRKIIVSVSVQHRTTGKNRLNTISRQFRFAENSKLPSFNVNYQLKQHSYLNEWFKQDKLIEKYYYLVFVDLSLYLGETAYFRRINKLVENSTGNIKLKYYQTEVLPSLDIDEAVIYENGPDSWIVGVKSFKNPPKEWKELKVNDTKLSLKNNIHLVEVYEQPFDEYEIYGHIPPNSLYYATYRECLRQLQATGRIKTKEMAWVYKFYDLFDENLRQENYNVEEEEAKILKSMKPFNLSDIFVKTYRDVPNASVIDNIFQRLEEDINKQYNLLILRFNRKENVTDNIYYKDVVKQYGAFSVEVARKRLKEQITVIQLNKDIVLSRLVSGSFPVTPENIKDITERLELWIAEYLLAQIIERLNPSTYDDVLKEVLSDCIVVPISKSTYLVASETDLPKEITVPGVELFISKPRAPFISLTNDRHWNRNYQRLEVHLDDTSKTPSEVFDYLLNIGYISYGGDLPGATEVVIFAYTDDDNKLVFLNDEIGKNKITLVLLQKYFGSNLSILTYSPRPTLFISKGPGDPLPDTVESEQIYVLTEDGTLKVYYGSHSLKDMGLDGSYSIRKLPKAFDPLRIGIKKKEGVTFINVNADENNDDIIPYCNYLKIGNNIEAIQYQLFGKPMVDYSTFKLYHDRLLKQYRQDNAELNVYQEKRVVERTVKMKESIFLGNRVNYTYESKEIVDSESNLRPPEAIVETDFLHRLPEEPTKIFWHGNYAALVFDTGFNVVNFTGYELNLLPACNHPLIEEIHFSEGPYLVSVQTSDRNYPYAILWNFISGVALKEFKYAEKSLFCFSLNNQYLLNNDTIYNILTDKATKVFEEERMVFTDANKAAFIDDKQIVIVDDKTVKVADIKDSKRKIIKLSTNLPITEGNLQYERIDIEDKIELESLATIVVNPSIGFWVLYLYVVQEGRVVTVYDYFQSTESLEYIYKRTNSTFDEVKVRPEDLRIVFDGVNISKMFYEDESDSIEIYNVNVLTSRPKSIRFPANPEVKNYVNTTIYYHKGDKVTTIWSFEKDKESNKYIDITQISGKQINKFKVYQTYSISESTGQLIGKPIFPATDPLSVIDDRVRVLLPLEYKTVIIEENDTITVPITTSKQTILKNYSKVSVEITKELKKERYGKKGEVIEKKEAPKKKKRGNLNRGDSIDEEAPKKNKRGNLNRGDSIDEEADKKKEEDRKEEELNEFKLINNKQVYNKNLETIFKYLRPQDSDHQYEYDNFMYFMALEDRLSTYMAKDKIGYLMSLDDDENESNTERVYSKGNLQFVYTDDGKLTIYPKYILHNPVKVIKKRLERLIEEEDNDKNELRIEELTELVKYLEEYRPCPLTWYETLWRYIENGDLDPNDNIINASTFIEENELLTPFEFEQFRKYTQFNHLVKLLKTYNKKFEEDEEGEKTEEVKEKAKLIETLISEIEKDTYTYFEAIQKALEYELLTEYEYHQLFDYHYRYNIGDILSDFEPASYSLSEELYNISNEFQDDGEVEALIFKIGNVDNLRVDFYDVETTPVTITFSKNGKTYSGQFNIDNFNFDGSTTHLTFRYHEEFIVDRDLVNPLTNNIIPYTISTSYSAERHYISKKTPLFLSNRSTTTEFKELVYKNYVYNFFGYTRPPRDTNNEKDEHNTVRDTEENQFGIVISDLETNKVYRYYLPVKTVDTFTFAVNEEEESIKIKVGNGDKAEDEFNFKLGNIELPKAYKIETYHENINFRRAQLSTSVNDSLYCIYRLWNNRYTSGTLIEVFEGKQHISTYNLILFSALQVDILDDQLTVAGIGEAFPGRKIRLGRINIVKGEHVTLNAFTTENFDNDNAPTFRVEESRGIVLKASFTGPLTYLCYMIPKTGIFLHIEGIGKDYVAKIANLDTPVTIKHISSSKYGNSVGIVLKSAGRTWTEVWSSQGHKINQFEGEGSW